MEGLGLKINVREIGEHLIIALVALQNFYDDLQWLCPNFWKVAFLRLSDGEGQGFPGWVELSIYPRLIAPGIDFIPTKISEIHGI